MLCLQQAASGLAQMSTSVAFDGYILSALLTIILIGSIYLSGRIAERRGRSFKAWAWIAGILIGPLALPLLFLLPDLHGKSGGHA
jgi:MFS family permease